MRHSEKVFNMNRLLIILILTLSFQSLTKADDISDFEIEGITLGDSLLNFFSKVEIDKNLRNFYNDDTYLITLLPTLNSDSKYEYIQVHFKKDDRKYIVQAIDGLIDIDIKECLKLQNNIVNEISSLFKKIKKIGPITYKHAADKSGKSTTKFFEWNFDNANIEVVCYDFFKPIEWPDGLNVSLIKNELQDWLNTKAYN